MFALSEKSAEKKTKTGRLPIAHYKQKPAGSDLWPVNRCIPTSKPNLEPGSIVLLKDEQQKRNEWPMGRVTQVFPSKDNKVCKVEVKVFKKEGPKVFIRPITKIILLLTPEQLD